jgi:hypothetical protein
MRDKQKTAKVLSTYELMDWFPDQQSALTYLTGVLWPEGSVCPFCDSTKYLSHYIGSFTSRLNEGNCRIDRLDSLIRGAQNRRLSYRMLTK